MISVTTCNQNFYGLMVDSMISLRLCL